jgi:hypothetical protein
MSVETLERYCMHIFAALICCCLAVNVVSLIDTFPGLRKSKMLCTPHGSESDRQSRKVKREKRNAKDPRCLSYNTQTHQPKPQRKNPATLIIESIKHIMPLSLSLSPSPPSLLTTPKDSARSAHSPQSSPHQASPCHWLSSFRCPATCVGRGPCPGRSRRLRRMALRFGW